MIDPVVLDALWNEWGMYFSSWHRNFRSVPIRLVDHVDKGGSYETDSAHVFALANGTFAYVRERGCSCYDHETGAVIEIYLTEADAIQRIKKDMGER